MLRLFERRTPGAPVAHIEVTNAGETYRVALKRVSTSRRFTLRVRAATRDVLLTMPARSSLAVGARVRRTPRRLDRRAAGAIAQAGRVRARRGDAIARRRSHDRPPSRRARRRLDRNRRARSLALRQRRSPAYSRAASPIFSSARRARTCKRRSRATPSGWPCRPSASCCATPRAAGARARRPAGSISPGG